MRVKRRLRWDQVPRGCRASGRRALGPWALPWALALGALAVDLAPAGAAEASGRDSRRGAVLVISSVDCVDDSFLGAAPEPREYEGNVRLVYNAVEMLSGGGPLLSIERREPAVRRVREGGAKHRSLLERGIERILTLYLEEAGEELGPDDEAFLRELALRSASTIFSAVGERWPEELSDARVSPAVLDLASRLEDIVRVEFYASESMPPGLQGLRRYISDYLAELGRASSGKIRVETIDPGRQSEESAARRAREYLRAVERGEEPEEPVPPIGPMELFAGRPAPRPADLRANRERAAREVAARTSREYEEVYRELLREDFSKAALQELEARGIVPGLVADSSAGGPRPRATYSALIVEYLDREPEVIPQIFSAAALEPELSRRIARLLRERRPTLLFVDASASPKEEGHPPSLPGLDPTASRGGGPFSRIAGFLGNECDVRLVRLAAGESIGAALEDLRREEARRRAEESGSPTPDNAAPAGGTAALLAESHRWVDCLVVARPERMEAGAVRELGQAVAAGVPAVLLVSRWTLDASPQGMAGGLPLRAIDPGEAFLELLSRWGIGLGERVLASSPCGLLTIQVPREIPSIGQTVVMKQAEPMHVLVAAEAEGLDRASSLLASVERLVLPATGGLRLIDDALERAGLEARVLARTPAETWAVAIEPGERGEVSMLRDYRDELIRRPRDAENPPFVPGTPLAILLRGSFPATP